MRILVTGATGFVGQYLLALLNRRRHVVRHARPHALRDMYIYWKGVLAARSVNAAS